MGDRTFSSSDVIRIYEDFLTSGEQKTVDNFFAGPPPEQIAATFDDLRALEGLITQARGPLPGLFGQLLTNLPFLASLVSTVMFATQQANILINQLLNLEEVDA